MEVRRSEKAGLKVQNDGTLTVALDTEIGIDLMREGYVRDLVRGVQNLRKESGLEVTDRIDLTLAGPPELKAALDDFADFVSGETLALRLEWLHEAEPGMTELEAGDLVWKASLARSPAKA